MDQRLPKWPETHQLLFALSPRCHLGEPHVVSPRTRNLPQLTTQRGTQASAVTLRSEAVTIIATRVAGDTGGTRGGNRRNRVPSSTLSRRSSAPPWWHRGFPYDVGFDASAAECSRFKTKARRDTPVGR